MEKTILYYYILNDATFFIFSATSVCGIHNKVLMAHIYRLHALFQWLRMYNVE
jgi:hypothetical protein